MNLSKKLQKSTRNGLLRMSASWIRKSSYHRAPVKYSVNPSNVWSMYSVSLSASVILCFRYEKYGKQYQYMQKIVALFETEPDNFERLTMLLMGMQVQEDVESYDNRMS